MDSSSESLRRQNRISPCKNVDSEIESELVLNSIQLLNYLDFDSNESTFSNTAVALYYNINQMQADEIDLFSAYFPFTEFFDIIINTENEEVQQFLFLSFCMMIETSNFNPEDIILPINLLLLLTFLDIPTLSECSINLLTILCEYEKKLYLILCEQGLLKKFIGKTITEIESNFIRHLSLYVKSSEFQIELASIVLQMFESNMIVVIHDGLKSYFSLFLNASSDEVRNYLCQISTFLVENFHKFVDFNDSSLISDYLDIIAYIEKLSDSFIPYAFELLNYDDIDIARAASNIFTIQFDNWSEKVDVDGLFEILLSKFDLDISVDCERIFFTTLLTYSDVNHMVIPQMISRIVKFAAFEKCTTFCLKAISLIFSTLDSVDDAGDLFGDLADEVYRIASDVYQNGNDESSDIACEILSFLDQTKDQ